MFNTCPVCKYMRHIESSYDTDYPCLGECYLVTKGLRSPKEKRKTASEKEESIHIAKSPDTHVKANPGKLGKNRKKKEARKTQGLEVTTTTSSSEEERDTQGKEEDEVMSVSLPEDGPVIVIPESQGGIEEKEVGVEEQSILPPLSLPQLVDTPKPGPESEPESESPKSPQDVGQRSHGELLQRIEELERQVKDEGSLIKIKNKNKIKKLKCQMEKIHMLLFALIVCGFFASIHYYGGLAAVGINIREIQANINDFDVRLNALEHQDMDYPNYDKENSVFNALHYIRGITGLQMDKLWKNSIFNLEDGTKLIDNFFVHLYLLFRDMITFSQKIQKHAVLAFYSFQILYCLALCIVPFLAVYIFITLVLVKFKR